MNAGNSLTFLTYFGLFVGLISGIVSQLLKTSVDVDGTTIKKLTSAGKLSLAISLFGFAGSFSSEILKSYIKAQEDAQNRFLKKQEAQWKLQVTELEKKILNNTNESLIKTERNLENNIEGFQAEQRNMIRTKIDILQDNLFRETRLYGRLSAANTPLSSLTLKIIAKDVPSALLKALSDGLKSVKDATSDPIYQDLSLHHNVDATDDAALMESEFEYKVLIPFINWLGEDTLTTSLRKGNENKWRSDQSYVSYSHQECILAICFGEEYSAMVGTGWITNPRIFPGLQESSSDSAKFISLLPSGILVGDEIDFSPSCYGGSVKTLQRKNSSRPNINLSIVGSTVSLSIDLNQFSLNDALLRYAKNYMQIATLPDVINIFTWKPYTFFEQNQADYPLQLPFDDKQMNIAGNVPIWDKSSNYITNAKRHLSVEIIPNGIDIIAQKYSLEFSCEGYIMEGPRGDDSRGYVRVWQNSQTK